MKQCKTCNEIKPLSEYWKMSKSADGLQYSCKPCCLELRRKYATPDYKQEQYLKNTYGLSKEDYEMMYLRQGFCCEICGIHETEAPRGKLFVDHCHETDAVRDLLCLNCNTALGHFKDNPELMQRGIEYVQKWKPYRETQEGEEASRSSQGGGQDNGRLQTEDVAVSSVA